MQDIYAFVGRRIRLERKARAMTLEELASAAGMNTSFLHSIETAKKRPSVAMLSRIADGLRLPLEKLFRDAPSGRQKEDPFVGKLTALVRDADSGRRKTILKIVRTLAKPSR